MNYLLATIKPWNITAAHKYMPHLPGYWHLITNKKELTPNLLDKLKPRYIFFPHWSWLVPKDILDRVECVCFHMTDVPYGRGGSPLQNLIACGHSETKLTALRMEEGLDSGPVYIKKRLSLKGTAQDIFERQAVLVCSIIKEIVENETVPIPQTGDVVLFERITRNRLPKDGNLESLYDQIRMRDAATYPKAFITHGEFKITFSEAILEGGELKTKVQIEKIGN